MVERSGRVGGWRGLFAAALMVGAPALAEPEAVDALPLPEASPGPLPAEPQAVEEPLSEGGKEAPSDGTPQVRIFGRLFARMSADEREEYARTLSIPSARVGVSASLRYLEAEVNADLSSKTLLKDAFVRLADGAQRLRLYGGQFKAPFLSRALESSWQLPLVRRGLVEDYLTETHQLGGRRLGLMGEVSVKEAWKLKVSGGVFQGAKDEELGTRASEDAALRVSVRPLKGLTLGASGYLAEVFEGTRRHAAAADATLKLGGLEVSGEYVTGRLAVGDFHAQLALASFTLPLGEEGWALQPVAGAEALQLRGPMRGQGHGFVGGLNVLFSEHFKALLQAEHALRPGDEAPGVEYSLQLATRF